MTWRRSAVSLGDASTATEAPTAPGTAFAVVSRFAIARSSLRRWPSRTPSFSIRQIGQDAYVYGVLAESGLVLLKAQAPQPDHDVHDGAHSGLIHHRAVGGACPGGSRSGSTGLSVSIGATVRTVPRSLAAYSRARKPAAMPALIETVRSGS